MTQGSSREAAEGAMGPAERHDDGSQHSRREHGLVPITQGHPDQYRSLFDHNFDAVFTLDRQGRFTEANASAERLSGFTESELRRMSLADLCSVDDRHEAMFFFARAMAGTPRSVELSAVCKDGGSLDLLMTGTPIFTEGTVVGVFCTARDMTSKRHAEAQLRRVRREAEQAKDRFLAVISHELRTPLMPVLTTIQMLQRRADVATQLQEELAMMRRNLELEARLIDDLLDLNRIRQGKLTLMFQHIDLHEKLRAVLSLCQAEIDDKQLQVELDLEAMEYRLGADAARLRQVFFNVIGNAVRYTPNGGQIRIRTCNGVANAKCHGDCHAGGRACKSCAPHGNFVAVHVTDTGIGISPETMERLFGAFERGDRSHSHVGGRGIGLAISRALVELHGGNLVCHSEGRGLGSTFTILLPLRNACVIEEDRTQNHKPRQAGTEAGRVLLVEDHADTARVLARLLLEGGYQTTVVGTVAAAREAIESTAFDLVISDIGLPDGSGTDVARLAKRKHLIPAIALSGYGMEDDIRRSRDAGFDEHLIKPIDVTRLQQTIARLIAR